MVAPTHDTLEQALILGIAPWQEIDLELDDVVVYFDRYPVTKGHRLFVPRCNNSHNITKAFHLAWITGESMVQQGHCQGFNVGINRGASAGQTVMYPHVHLIPRYQDDCLDPTGGVRGVIPGQANYKKQDYKNPTDK